MDAMLDEKLPDISVVIPAHNEERYISDCLRSLAKQNFAGNYEIIVVNNASTDHTTEIAREHGVTVVHESIRGVCNARQKGTKIAKGKIIVSTDADTVFKPDWLSNINTEFERNHNVTAVIGPFLFANAPVWGKFYVKKLFGFNKLIYELTGKVWYPPAANFAFKKSAWPGYNTALTQGGDEFDLLKKLQRQGKAVYLHENYVLTSSRRLSKGLFYNIFVTLFLYYIVNYAITKITGKNLLGSYHAIR